MIGVARDEAFQFIYADNLRLLEELGAKIVFFSPLHDSHLQEGLQGVLLYGGYPELYAEKLSANVSMRKELKTVLEAGMPCMAECGGYMYLSQQMEDMDQKTWPMVGAVPGEIYRTKKLEDSVISGWKPDRTRCSAADAGLCAATNSIILTVRTAARSSTRRSRTGSAAGNVCMEAVRCWQDFRICITMPALVSLWNI